MAKQLPALEEFELSEIISTRFDPDTFHELRSKARKIGLAPSVLIRMWVMERLQREKRLRKQR